MGSKRQTPHWRLQRKMSTRYRLNGIVGELTSVWPVRGRQWLMDAQHLMEQIVTQTSCESRKSILVGWHHLPTKPASPVSREQQRKLCWEAMGHGWASSFHLPVLHVFLPKWKKSFREILTTVRLSNSMLSSKTTTDSQRTGGLGRVPLSTVALPSRGHRVQPGHPVACYFLI